MTFPGKIGQPVFVCNQDSWGRRPLGVEGLLGKVAPPRGTEGTRKVADPSALWFSIANDTFLKADLPRTTKLSVLRLRGVVV